MLHGASSTHSAEPASEGRRPIEENPIGPALEVEDVATEPAPRTELVPKVAQQQSEATARRCKGIGRPLHQVKKNSSPLSVHSLIMNSPSMAPST